MSQKIVLVWTLCVITVLALAACSAPPSELGSAPHRAQILEDRAATQNFTHGQIISLSIEEALELGIQTNMDARVSALEYLSAQDDVTLEKLQAFPSVKYALTRSGRSNSGASSSMSAATGLQSLEPSISSEQYRTLRDLDVNWNLIDVAAAVMQSRSSADRAGIAEERHRKVLQNIRKDVYVAYWRAQADQETHKQTLSLLGSMDAQYDNLNTAVEEKLISRGEGERIKSELRKRRTELEELQSEASSAVIELQGLLSLPYGADLDLTTKTQDLSGAMNAATSKDAETLELIALEQRPEMHEAFLEQNISARDTRLEILRTIPGAELFFGMKNDTNRFLEDRKWASFSAAIVQNITELVTLPARYRGAKNQEELSRARHLAKATAVMAQVHLARHSLIYARRQYENAKDAEQGARYTGFATQKSALAGQSSAQESLLARLDAHMAYIRSRQAYAAMQDAYASLILSLGLEVGKPVSWKKPEAAG
jgi:multidrug efflux system outer membrane protein